MFNLYRLCHKLGSTLKLGQAEEFAFSEGFDTSPKENNMLFPSITRNCIIEEQDDHIVVAIRIPKAEIANNIHFLAALADVVPTVGSPCAAEIA
jgi:hypothetical protein